MGQDSAAPSDPVRVPAEEAEQEWVTALLPWGRQVLTLPGRTAVWGVQTVEGRSTEQDLVYTTVTRLLDNHVTPHRHEMKVGPKLK